MTGASRRVGRGTPAIAVATVSIILAMLPVFLLGGLAVLLRPDLGFGEAGLGVAVAAYFGAGALAAVPGGRLAERLGSRQSLLAAGIVGGLALVGIAVLARSLWSLVAFLTVAGLANGLVQPAGNLILAHSVPRANQALGFGIKQAAVPAASLLAGLAVPVVGLTVGWRWAFAGAACLTVVLFPLLPPPGAGALPRARSSGRRVLSTGLVLLTAAAGVSAAAGNSMMAFLVEGLVASGLSPGAAGTILAVGSACGVAARIVAGWIADRLDRDLLHVVAGMLFSGVVGYGLLASGRSPWSLTLGAVVAFSGAWAWAGVFNHAIVLTHPRGPASASGVLLVGIFTGSVVGPLGFGWLVALWSFRFAWGAAVVCSIVAALLVVGGRRLLPAPAPLPSPLEDIR